MKIALPNDSKQGVGGGWTFQRNLKKGLEALGQTVVDDPLQADVALLCGVTMVTKETVRAIKEEGIKLVVRLDNVPRNSRNKGAGTTRLQRFSELADQVVWQGEWAKFYLEDFIGKEGVIIHNGVDQDIFNTISTSTMDGADRKNNYLYSRFNRDETKMWEAAWYEYQLVQRENKDAMLIIVGKFSPEQHEYYFDFFRGENVQYLGVIEDPKRMASIMQNSGQLMATYYNDAFSNTYLEALCCGMELYKPNMTGGTPEIIKLWNEKGREYFTLERMAKDYLKVFENL